MITVNLKYFGAQKDISHFKFNDELKKVEVGIKENGKNYYRMIYSLVLFLIQISIPMITVEQQIKLYKINRWWIIIHKH